MDRRLALGLKILAGLAAIPAVLVVGMGLVGLALSSEPQFVLTEAVDAPPDRVFQLVSTEAGLQQWWAAAGPPTGAPAGLEITSAAGTLPELGAAIDYRVGEQVFETWTVLAVQAPGSITYDVDFKVFRATRVLALTPTAAGTSITWTETAHLGNPWLRWIPVIFGMEDAAENRRIAMRAIDEVVPQ